MSTESDPGSPALEALLDTLDLENIDRDIFRGKSPPTRLQRVFGGQVASQALVAAQRTVPDRLVHSLHAYFLRRGVPEQPIVYEVDRIRDGHSYTTRRVVGIQDGRAIFNLQASFHIVEEGYQYQPEMPPPPADPADLPVMEQRFGPTDADPRPGPSVPFDIRQAPAAPPYDRMLWLRTIGPVADDPVLHQCLVAYASDLTLLGTALQPLGPPVPVPAFIASLDHAMWFHRPFRIDEWMLYAQSALSTGAGRGLSQGHLFTRDGRLALTVVQEGVLRP